jgi:hypothetical protein
MHHHFAKPKDAALRAALNAQFDVGAGLDAGCGGVG